MYTVGHSRLISTGVYLPEERVTSRELLRVIDSKARFGIPYDWLDRAMGIRERRFAPRNMLPSEMAARAARQALEIARLSALELDAVIYVGVDRDYSEPATAHIVQDMLSARNAVSFDVTNACHGFMNGIHLMDALVATGQVRRGLIVTGEQASRAARKAVELLQQTDNGEEFFRLAAGLSLGDAGAAMVVGPKLGPDSGFMGFMLESHAEYATLCVCGDNRGQEIPLQTDMTRIVAANTRLHAKMYKEFLARLRWQPPEIDRFVHHQVGLKVFRYHAEYTGVPIERMPNTVSTCGNLVTATIPVNLHNLLMSKELGAGAKVFLSGSGSGLAISQAGLVWDAA